MSTHSEAISRLVVEYLLSYGLPFSALLIFFSRLFRLFTSLAEYFGISVYESPRLAPLPFAVQLYPPFIYCTLSFKFENRGVVLQASNGVGLLIQKTFNC